MFKVFNVNTSQVFDSIADLLDFLKLSSVHELYSKRLVSDYQYYSVSSKTIKNLDSINEIELSLRCDFDRTISDMLESDDPAIKDMKIVQLIMNAANKYTDNEMAKFFDAIFKRMLVYSVSTDSVYSFLDSINDASSADDVLSDVFLVEEGRHIA